MEESTGKRTRRKPEELAAALDVQIEKLEQSISGTEVKKEEAIAAYDRKIETVRVRIAELEKKKKALLAPKPPRKPRKTKKQKIEALVQKAVKSGAKPEEIAQALGVSIED